MKALSITRYFPVMITFFLFLFLVPSGCKKDRDHTLPNVRINEYLVINEPSNFALKSPGGWVYHQGGLRGLIVMRRYMNGDDSDFAAYDRACPLHYQDDCGRLEVSDDDITVECPCDQGKYTLFDGSAQGSNESPPLREYRTQFDGYGVRIRN